MTRLLRDRHQLEQQRRERVQQHLTQDTHHTHSTASPGNLRGIPVIAHGVTGATPGSSPHAAFGTAAA